MEESHAKKDSPKTKDDLTKGDEQHHLTWEES